MVEAPKKEVIRENFTTVTLVDGRVLSVKDAFKVGSYIYTSVTEVLLEDGTVSYNKTAIEPGLYETNNE